jgi:hypothetical protein
MAKILALLGAKGGICELVHEYYDVTLRNYTIGDDWLTRKMYRFERGCIVPYSDFLVYSRP